MSTSSAAVVGILLILFAIPFGLMLAPLAIGIIVLVVALRRLDGEFAIRGASAA